MGCVDVTGSILVDSVIVIHLVTCGSVPGLSSLGIVTLDSSLVFGTMVGFACWTSVWLGNAHLAVTW